MVTTSAQFYFFSGIMECSSNVSKVIGNCSFRGLRRSDRVKLIKRSFSPDNSPASEKSAYDVGRRMRSGQSPVPVASDGHNIPVSARRNRKSARGKPFSCAVCKSPHVCKPSRRKNLNYVPAPRLWTNPITLKVLTLCNACGITFNTQAKAQGQAETKRRARLVNAQDRSNFREEAQNFGKALSEKLQDSDSINLYCSRFTCRCIQRHLLGGKDNINGPFDEQLLMRQSSRLLRVMKQAKQLKMEKCYNPQEVQNHRKKNIGIGNGQRRSENYEQFVYQSRSYLKTDVKLCEQGVQKVLLYSNNFLHKRLRTENASRSERFNGKKPSQFLPIDELPHHRCCLDNCVNLATTHGSLLQQWRDRAVQGIAERRQVIAEMLTPSGGGRSNCYSFIQLVTGSSKGAISRVSINTNMAGGARVLYAHGLKGKSKKRVQEETVADSDSSLDTNVPQLEEGEENSVDADSQGEATDVAEPLQRQESAATLDILPQLNVIPIPAKDVESDPVQKLVNLQAERQELEQQLQNVVQQQQQCHQQLLHLAIQQQLEQQQQQQQQQPPQQMDDQQGIPALSKQHIVHQPSTPQLSMQQQYQPAFQQVAPQLQARSVQGAPQSSSYCQPMLNTMCTQSGSQVAALPGMRMFTTQPASQQATIHHYPQAVPLLAQERLQTWQLHPNIQQQQQPQQQEQPQQQQQQQQEQQGQELHVPTQIEPQTQTQRQPMIKQGTVHKRARKRNKSSQQNQSIQQLLQQIMALNAAIDGQDPAEPESAVQEGIGNGDSSHKPVTSSMQPSYSATPHTCGDTGRRTTVTAHRDGCNDSADANHISVFDDQTLSGRVSTERMTGICGSPGTAQPGSQLPLQAQSGTQSLSQPRGTSGNVLMPGHGVLGAQQQVFSPGCRAAWNQDSTSGSFHAGMLSSVKQLNDCSIVISTVQNTASNPAINILHSENSQYAFGFPDHGASNQPSSLEGASRTNFLSWNADTSNDAAKQHLGIQTQTRSDGTVTLSVPINTAGTVDLSNMVEALMSAANALRVTHSEIPGNTQ
ncbi:PREDICTED: polyhomeotic-proximal chromatin protein-like [Priapulus caudatus]|uniref:Polyhomeotic-proximal chromatin protein-like n=1 Tax=Priapulus caudatus TaxID=37621 RepID=A0ABM1FA72_PRICU|nr:PREDICTED: polyhomeotic-proximal chromatin protein-like [Priapulus caudatus]